MTRYLLGPEFFWLLLYAAATWLGEANNPPAKAMDNFIEKLWFWIPVIMKKYFSSRIVFTALFGFQITVLTAQWSAVLTGAADNMNCVSLVGNQIFIGGDQIVKSPNGGANWSVGPLMHNLGFELIGTTLNDIHFFDAQNGVAVGLIVGAGEDIILRSTNGGASWSYAYQGFGNGGALFILHDLFFINSTTGWAVGRNGNIYKTTNAGASWVLQPSGTSNELYSVWFVNANLGFAAGDNVLLKTTNGGASWSPTGLNGAEKVVFADAGTGYAGHGNTLYKTTNGGQNWALLTLPEVSGYLTDLHLFGAQICYALFNNTVLRSTDGGQSWEETTGPAVFSETRQFDWLDSQQAVAVGGAVFCWITGNAGEPYKPMADYDIPQPLCSGVPQTIMNKTADLPNYTYQWSLNGVLVSTQRNPEIIFPDPATNYNLRLEVSNGTAIDVAEYFLQTETPVQIATPEIFLSSNQLCQGDQLVLYADLNNAAYWTLFANGQPTGVAGNLAQISYPDYPQSTTTYQLHGELAGVCNIAAADALATVTVTPLPLTVAILAEKTLVCPGEVTRILIPNSVPGVAYRLYAFSGSGNPNETQTGNGDTLFFQTPPVQDYLYYQLEVSNQNCLRNLGQVVTVAPEYLLALLYQDQITGAVGTPIQLNDTFNLIGPYITWNFGPQAQPSTATGLNPVFQYTEPGFYTFYVEAAGQGDCAAHDSMRIEVFGQNNLPAGNFSACSEYPTPLLASEVEAREHILDVHRAADGTIYTVGYRTEYAAGFHHNLSINKLDAAGNLLWSYFLPQSDQNYDVVQRIGTTIAADEAGNMYVTGTYYGSEIQLGGQIVYSGPPVHEGFVIKLDPAGNLLWKIRAPGSGPPVGVTDLLYLNDQQIYLVAPETGILEFADGFRYVFPPGNLMGLIQINADGHLVRAQSIARTAGLEYHVILSNFNPNLSIFVGPATTRLSPRMALDKQGRLVLVGEYRSPMWLDAELLTPKILQQRNGFVTLASQNLEVLDAFSTYGVADISFNSSDIFHQVNTAPAFALDADGNIFQSFSIDQFYTYPPPFQFAEVVDDQVEYGNDSHFLLKYSPSGDLLWRRRNGPLRTPWLATTPDGAVHTLASHGPVLGINDADGTKRSLISLGGSDLALLSWAGDGAVAGAVPLGSDDDDDAEWFLSDGCGGLTGLLARRVGQQFIDDPLQYFQLAHFGQTSDCTPVCPFEICQQPEALAFCQGENAYLFAGAVGENLSYQWQRETGPGVHVNLTDDAVYSGTQTALLQVAASQAPLLAGQQFLCLVTNSLDSTLVSSPATLLPLDTPVVAPLPLLTSVATDQFASVVAHAQGNGLQYEWQYLSFDGWRPVADLPFYYYTNEDSMLLKGYDIGFQNGQELRCRIFNANGCLVYTTVTTLQFVTKTNYPVATDWAVKVDPSPFTDKLHLTAEASDNDALYWTVYDVGGRELLRLTGLPRQKHVLPTHPWPPGIYQVRVQSGNKVMWKRVVKMN